MIKLYTSVFIRVMLLLVCVSASAERRIFDGNAEKLHRILTEETTESEETCNEVDKCQMCTFSDQKSVPACKQTGRMQKFKCVVLSDEGEILEKRTEIRSCRRTEADEEFGMVRLQMLCLVMGSLAFLSVRKQKRYSASLFDQRKQGIAQQPKPRGRRNSDMAEEEEIEFTPMTNQETVPLVDTSSNPLEVI